MAAQLGGILFAALSFSASGWLFHKLDKSGYDAEMKRHNLAMEHLSKAREKWYEEEVAKKDELARKRAELLQSKADLSTVNRALDALRKMDVVYHDGQKKYTFKKKPKLKDFYTPSDKFKKYQNITMGLTGIGSGLLLGLLI